MPPAPLAVLLLPTAVERMESREEVEALLRWPGVVAIEPGRLPPLRGGRAVRAQAKRLCKRLPGRPAVIVVYADEQRPLAEELRKRTEGSEVWYEPGEGPLRERLPGRGFGE
jgi:hypothetical protein